MNWLANVLPSAVERWTVVNGNKTLTELQLNAGGYATCTLTNAEISSIPMFFQLFAKHTADTTWKAKELFATLEVIYDASSSMCANIPANESTMDGPLYVTENAVRMQAGSYLSCTFKVTNNTAQAVTFSVLELRPIDDGIDAVRSIAESAVTTADEALAEAIAKATVFFAQPTTPYHVDDLWFDSGGIIRKCTVERLNGPYVAGDWGLWMLRADYVVANIEIDSPIITGGIFRTATSGARWVIDTTSLVNVIEGYSGLQTEQYPSQIVSEVKDALLPMVSIKTGNLGFGISIISVWGPDGINAGGASISVMAANGASTGTLYVAPQDDGGSILPALHSAVGPQILLGTSYIKVTSQGSTTLAVLQAILANKSGDVLPNGANVPIGAQAFLTSDNTLRIWDGARWRSIATT